MLLVFALRFSLPTFLALALIAIVLKFSLQFLFKLLHVPNFSTTSPSNSFSWGKPAPSDVLFRLAFFAALNLVLYWMPIYYGTTYPAGEDDRSGLTLIYAVAFCPVSWILGILCYVQAWRARAFLTTRERAAFYITSSALLLVILSTVIPQIKLHLGAVKY